MRRRLIAGVTFLAGLFYLAEYLLPPKVMGRPTYLSEMVVPVSNFLIVVAAFSLGLGWANLMGAHAKVLARRAPGWINSLAFFLSVGAMFFFGLWKQWPGLKPPGWVEGGYRLIFEYIMTPLVATVFSLLAFYIVSAAYRAFKVKNLEASLMMGSAFVVMLGQIPVGGWLSQGLPHPLRLPTLGAWIMTQVNTPACRGIIFGAAMGAIAMALRIWLSLERGGFFEREVS